uniref:Myb-like domain-containing protein n=1 Tax=Macrostomum lignano TaxID=282301 RepID=A0A1I8FEF5_9PLAT
LTRYRHGTAPRWVFTKVMALAMAPSRAPSDSACQQLFDAPKLGTAKPQCPPASPTVQPKSPLPFMPPSLPPPPLEFEDATRDEEDIDSDIETAVPSVSEILNLFNKQNVLSKAKKPSSSKQPARTANPAGAAAGSQQGASCSSSASSFSRSLPSSSSHPLVQQQQQQQQQFTPSPAVPHQAPQKLESNSECKPPPPPRNGASAQAAIITAAPSTTPSASVQVSRNPSGGGPGQAAIIAQLQQGVPQATAVSHTQLQLATSSIQTNCRAPSSLLLKPVHSKDPEPAIPAASVATAPAVMPSDSNHSSRQRTTPAASAQLTDAELASVPGYSAIPPGTPDWKRALLERKNREAIDSFSGRYKPRRERQERWQRAVPSGSAS